MEIEQMWAPLRELKAEERIIEEAMRERKKYEDYLHAEKLYKRWRCNMDKASGNSDVYSYLYNGPQEEIDDLDFPTNNAFEKDLNPSIDIDFSGITERGPDPKTPRSFQVDSLLMCDMSINVSLGSTRCSCRTKSCLSHTSKWRFVYLGGWSIWQAWA